MYPHSKTLTDSVKVIEGAPVALIHHQVADMGSNIMRHFVQRLH